MRVSRWPSILRPVEGLDGAEVGLMASTHAAGGRVRRTPPPNGGRPRRRSRASAASKSIRSRFGHIGPLGTSNRHATSVRARRSLEIDGWAVGAPFDVADRNRGVRRRHAVSPRTSSRKRAHRRVPAMQLAVCRQPRVGVGELRRTFACLFRARLHCQRACTLGVLVQRARASAKRVSAMAPMSPGCFSRIASARSSVGRAFAAA